MAQNQLIERLGKIKEDIGDCVAQMQEDLKRDNQLINNAYLTELANCIENVEVSIVRTHIIFATNILENLKKITEKEEKRREIMKTLSAVQLRDDVKNQRKRKRLESKLATPYKRKTSLTSNLQIANIGVGSIIFKCCSNSIKN